jgi:predicted HicB family RNase H-like nuclease
MNLHPVAALFPMMSDEELDELADDIRANGLLNPITVDQEGVLIDGRNRLEACKRAGVEPQTEILNGTDPVAYILAQNVKRRQLNKGQQAMAVAFAYPDSEHGRGKKDPAKKHADSASFSYRRIQEARQVLHHSRDLARAVLSDVTKLDEALQKVITEKKETESTEGKLAQLRNDAPDLAELVSEERLALAEAYNTFLERKRDAEERKKSERETVCRIGESTYRETIAWSVKEFSADVEEMLKDKEFHDIFINRVRLDRTQIPNIIEGAIALTSILKKL